MIRLLVSDIDGTLVTPDKVVTPAAREAVHALIDAGIAFRFVSSRPPRGVASIVEALGIGGDDEIAGAAFNGGALVDGRLKPLAFEPLDVADVRTTLDTFDALGVAAWVFTLDEWRVTDPNSAYVALEEHTVGFRPTIVERFDDLAGVGKIVGSSADPDLLARAGSAIAPRLSTHARGLRSQAYYLDVTHVEANKGHALRAIASAAGLAIDEVAAIGDMTNDLPMLEIAGFSIAMGNAPDAVKAVADAVTASDRDEGFARAVHELVLPRAARK